MDKFLESVSKRDFDGRILEVVEMLEEKQLFGTISLIKDLKYYLDLAIEEKAHTCKCQHNSNSRDDEPCCRCDSRQTNADRIRNMSDEELGDLLQSVNSGAENGNPFISLCVDDNEITMNFSDIYEWLQLKAE